jgi:hypothetical protein
MRPLTLARRLDSQWVKGNIIVSLVNKYFHQPKRVEQEIIDGFVQESIQIRGKTYYYLPRRVQISDLIFGEDILSSFSLAIPIEMYLTDTLGFQGDREMFSKFGLEVKNSYKLVVSNTRWEDEIKSQFDNEEWNGEANFDIENYLRPREGDLIYDPITKFLMEIKFVDHDVEFFALEKNYQYYLTCEAFQYQNEELDTGIEDIDLITSNSRDMLLNQVLLENGNTLIYENGGYVLLDIPAVTAIRKNETIYIPEAGEIQYTVINPFEL